MKKTLCGLFTAAIGILGLRLLQKSLLPPPSTALQAVTHRTAPTSDDLFAVDPAKSKPVPDGDESLIEQLFNAG